MRPTAAKGVAPCASAILGRGNVPLTTHALEGLKAVRSRAMVSRDGTNKRVSVPTPPVASRSHIIDSLSMTSAAGAESAPPPQALVGKSGSGVGAMPPAAMGGAALYPLTRAPPQATPAAAGKGANRV